MSTQRTICLWIVLVVLALATTNAHAQLITGGESLIEKYNPFRQTDPSEPVTVLELSKRLDCIGEKMRNDGLVVIKRPDVFSQARMTHFRTDFENQMMKDLVTFHLVLSARINRLDSATTTQSTSLAASLAAPGTANVHTGGTGSAGSSPSASSGLPPVPTLPSNGMVAPGTSATLDPNKNAFSNVGVDLSNPLALVNSNTAAAMNLGVEPTVYLDEKKRFLEHLNQIRRINHGPDQNDSSGYGLYLLRLPVSITPGECTYHGHGAELAVTVEHEFPPDFLKSAFRNLVINDLVDQLGPVVYEVIRSGKLSKIEDLYKQQQQLARELPLLLKRQKAELRNAIMAFKDRRPERRPLFVYPLADFILHYPPAAERMDRSTLDAVLQRLAVLLWAREKTGGDPDALEATRSGMKERANRYLRGQNPTAADRENIAENVDNLLSKVAAASGDQDQVLMDFIDQLYDTHLPDDVATLQNAAPGVVETLQSQELTRRANRLAEVISKNLTLSLPSTRNPKVRYPVPPQEVMSVFLQENIYVIAQDINKSLLTKVPRATDVRNYLRTSLYAAFDVMDGKPNSRGDALLNDVGLLSSICEAVAKRDYGKGGSLRKAFEQFVQRLSTVETQIKDENERTNYPIVALCWAVAVDATLLDDALHEWIPKVFAANDVDLAVPEEMHFYVQDEALANGANTVFQDFVKYRWPLITFAVDPVAEQQNIADSFTLQRDLQLALSFAFATGQISFSQMNTFRRQIQQSSDTIALNRTVTGFTHGNDTFGFRFTPRFQNPPQQRTNIGVIATQLIGGGPGPDYGTRKSKLEPGMRELTVTVLAPSFMPTLRMQVSSNWFKLIDPEHLIFHTKRMLERGREVQELRQAVVDECSSQRYRDADLRVLRAKLTQLEAMLPAQSTVVQLPFENSASGFELFTDGVTALVPELSGYDGVDIVTKPATATSNPLADIFVYGKYIDLLDTRVIVGGAYVPPMAQGTPATGGFEIISREVAHVIIPSTAQQTVTIDDKTYLEVYLATPSGISNRVLVPFQPAAPPPLVAFDLNASDPNSTELDIFYQWQNDNGTPTLVATDDPGTVDKKPLKITWDAGTGMAPKTLQATLSTTAGGYLINIALPANSGAKDDYAIDRQVLTVCLLKELQKVLPAQSMLPDPLTVTISVQPYIPLDSMGYRVISKAKQLKTTLTVRLIPKSGHNVLPNVICPLPPPAASPKADGTTLRSVTPAGDSILQTSLSRASQLPLNGQAIAGELPQGLNLPSLSSSLQGGIPPLPTSLIASEMAAASRFASIAPANVIPAQIQTLAPALPTLPPIVVHSSPVTVVAPSTVLQPKAQSMLSRLLHRDRNDRSSRGASQR